MEYDGYWTIEEHSGTGRWWLVRYVWWKLPDARVVGRFIERFPTATAACAYLETL